MRIALAQNQPSNNAETSLIKVLDYCNQAASHDCELVCFNQFFLGLPRQEYDSNIIDTLANSAAKNDIAIVTGNLIVNSDNNEASSAFFDRNGKMSAFSPEIISTPEEEATSRLFDTSMGPMMVLSGLEAYDSEIDTLILKISPKVLLMQTSATSLLELEAIKELAIERSLNQAHLTLVVSMVKEFDTEKYLGSTMAVMQGQILAETATRDEELAIVDVDPERILDYSILRESVTIPELLRQKLVHDSSIRESSKKMEL